MAEPPNDRVDLSGEHPVQPGLEQTQTPAVYDPSHTTKFKRPAAYLDDMRAKNPQGTIDYLFERKELYKTAALRQQQRAQVAEKKLLEAQKEVEEWKRKSMEYRKNTHTWKARSQKELAMKKWWKMACCTVTVGLVTMIVVLLTITQIISVLSPRHREETPQRVPTSGKAPNTPNHVLASVNIFNGTKQGSGTVISKGDQFAAVLTAGHNFKGAIGGPFWVYYPDGTYTKGTLIAIDRDRDLALGRVDVTTILGHSYVPEKFGEGTLSGCGYTGGQGPNYRTLCYNSAYKNQANKWMWDLSVTSGPFWDGDSGSGVFIEDACVGVTSQRDALVYINQNTYYKKLYAVSHSEIVAFLNENTSALAGCGDWSLKSEAVYGGDDAPPLWAPKPNIPINTPNGTDKLIRDLQADVAALKKQVGGPPLIRPGDIVDPKKAPLPKDDGLKRPSEIK